VIPSIGDIEEWSKRYAIYRKIVSNLSSTRVDIRREALKKADD